MQRRELLTDAEDAGVDLAATLRSAARNYRYRPNVCAIGFGSKFSDGRKVRGTRAVQFFVTRKVPLAKLSRPLPGFVHPRSDDGTTDRGRAIPTDVIEVRNLAVCCAAGDKVAMVGRNGAITLLFRDRAQPGEPLRMLTCAHVVGDLGDSPPAATLVGGNDDCLLMAEVAASAVATDDHLEFDIAIADITAGSDPFDPLRVEGSAVPLAAFLPGSDWTIGDSFPVVFPHSGSTSITLESTETAFRDIRVGGTRTISIGNLHACKGKAISGDSGGIVYRDDRAVGILVARADDDWVFIHAIEDAVQYLARETGQSIACF